MKQLDSKLPVKLEDILVRNNGLEAVLKSDNENSPMTIDSVIKNQEQPPVSAKSEEETLVIITYESWLLLLSVPNDNLKKCSQRSTFFYVLLQPSNKQNMQKLGSSKDGEQKTRKVKPQVNYGS